MLASSVSPSDPSVGNREALLEGARKCLSEKGYARTTARDIAAASGVSLAAIGYHFRTTEALLNEAVFAGIGQWAEQLGHGGTVLEKFEAVWTRVIESFHDYRGVLAASYEIMVRAEEVPEVRRRLAAATEAARIALAELFRAWMRRPNPSAHARSAPSTMRSSAG
jgi:AcrR family transcriptional regulator